MNKSRNLETLSSLVETFKNGLIWTHIPKFTGINSVHVKNIRQPHWPGDRHWKDGDCLCIHDTCESHMLSGSYPGAQRGGSWIQALLGILDFPTRFSGTAFCGMTLSRSVDTTCRDPWRQSHHYVASRCDVSLGDNVLVSAAASQQEGCGFDSRSVFFLC